MEILPSQLKARLDRCRHQRQRVVTCQEQEGWWAEEAGLLDAFLGRDQTGLAAAWYPSQFQRYQLGLHEGQAIMRVFPCRSWGHEQYGGAGPSSSHYRPGRTAVSTSPSTILVEERR